MSSVVSVRAVTTHEGPSTLFIFFLVCALGLFLGLALTLGTSTPAVGDEPLVIQGP